MVLTVDTNGYSVVNRHHEAAAFFRSSFRHGHLADGSSGMNVRVLWLRCRALLAHRRVQRELDEELAFHIEREAREHMAAGLGRDEALAVSRSRFGSVPLAAERCRDARGTAFIETVVRDVMYGARAFGRSPLAGLTIAATIALGLALVTVAFTVYNALFLRVDAVRHPEELFTVERLTRPDLPHPPGSNRAWQSTNRHEFDLFRHDTGILTDAVAIQPGIAARIDGRAVDVTLVSGNFFQMLGASAAIGRTLLPSDDDDGVTGQQVLVLSHRGWNKLFTGDQAAIGQDVRVNGSPYLVAGVMPEDFRGLSTAPPDFWVPLSLAGRLVPGMAAGDGIAIRTIVGRLPPGMRPQQAEAALTAWASGRTDMRRNTPHLPNSITLTPSRGTLWPQSFRGLTAPLFVAFAMVLMIGCANVANLLFARGVSRQREIGIRLALGGSRPRIVRQLFTESLMLALAAAACAALLSRWMLAGALYLTRTAMPQEVAEHISVAPMPIDWRVLLFLTTAAMVSTMLFGLMPAIRATRLEVVQTIKGQLTTDPRPERARHALIALQVCASALLLVASGVFLRSAFDAATADVGVRAKDTLTVAVAHESARATMVDQLTTHPSVELLAAAWPWPRSSAFGKAQARQPAIDNGSPAGKAQAETTSPVGYDLVSPSYFKVLGIDVLKGRGFAPDELTADAGVAVVSERGARRLWPNGEVVGQSIRLTTDSTDVRPTDAVRPSSRLYTIVGVVKDIGLTSGPRGGLTVLDNPDVYLPASLETPGTSFVLRIHGDPDEARLALLDRLIKVDPALGEIKTLRMMTQGFTYLLWLAFWATVLLGGLALALTASGLFSVMSFVVEQRKKDIGVRIALGATSRNIAKWVFSETFTPVGIGMAAGVALAAACVKILVGWLPFLLGGVVRVFDPLLYAVGVLIILSACLLAASIPARRAAGVDPMETLRHD